MNPIFFEIMKRKIKIEDLRSLLADLERNELNESFAHYVVIDVAADGEMQWEQPSAYSECFSRTGVLKTEKYE